MGTHEWQASARKDHWATWKIMSAINLNPSPCAKAIISAWKAKDDAESTSSSNQIKLIYEEELVSTTLKTIAASDKERRLWLSRKQQIPLRKHLVASASAPFIALGMGIGNFLLPGGQADFRDLHRSTRLRLGAKTFVVGLRTASTWKLLSTHTEQDHSAHEARGEYPVEYTICRDVGNTLLNRLKRMNLAAPEDLQELCRLMLKDETPLQSWDEWSNSILMLLAQTLSSIVTTEILSSDKRIGLVLSDQDRMASGSRQVSIVDSQEHIRAHIGTYASRVGQHRLDSAVLVCRDAEEAILEIWRTMPDGFGRRGRPANAT
ncbi:hypothetical protein FRC12_019104 [Ceratobasidium sp. 428]|nr:hypothetical protein FRC12_019104 [Ceratobasidium sp. 428]